MDTPNKSQIGTPASKVEDSPVFNYINSLSPIKTVRSLNIAHTFNSLSFASPPSVFTSPHVSSQKEPKFLRRHQFSVSSRFDLSSENGFKSNSVGILDAGQVSECPVDPAESLDTNDSIREVPVDPTNGNLELPIELPRTLNYVCGSPECDPAPSHGIKTDPSPVTSDVPATLCQSVKVDAVERCLSFQNRVDLQGICQNEQIKEEEGGCDWQNLISDATDLLNFDSSNDAEAPCVPDQKIDGPGSSSFSSLLFPQNGSDDTQTTQHLGLVGSCGKHDTEHPSAQSREVENQKETNQTQPVISSAFQNEQTNHFPSEKVDKKDEKHVPFGCQQRGIRRRCLVFESAGAQKKKLEDDSNSSSSVSSQSGGQFASQDKKLLPPRPCTSSAPCIIPAIGLHLNALAATTKDSRVIKHETLSSGKELISMPSSMSSFHSQSSEQKPLNKSLVLSLVGTDMGPAGNEAQVMQDASRASGFKVGEEFNDNSPKKKRRRLEHAGESEAACKRCNCKKSKCLKLYCECFAAGVYCVEPCSCQECFNKPIHEDTVLATRKQIESRNPLAFAPKVIRSSEPVPEIGEESNKTPASARHKRGCNCKKSSCLKKYCECYQGGVGCSINCRCEGCKNKYGRKDGSTPIGIEEVEPEDEEPEACEKDSVARSLQTDEVRKEEEQCVENVLPITFSFQICRASVQLPFSSFGKPPRSSLPPQPKFEKHFQITPEDETPEILRGNSSPISGVKSASPNRKRVSPPHSGHPLSPGRKSSRKLVLQSIPAFPSLTQHKDGDS